MIKQTLMFTSPVYLALKDQQMVITFKDNQDTVTRPIEDIGFVVIEHPQVSISVPLLNELADNNVSVVFCDKKQMPKTMLMTLDGNTTQQESYKYTRPLENALSLTTASLLRMYKGETDKLSLPMIT
jgi:CRISPR-associated protein Cas1